MPGLIDLTARTKEVMHAIELDYTPDENTAWTEVPKRWILSDVSFTHSKPKAHQAMLDCSPGPSCSNDG